MMKNNILPSTLRRSASVIAVILMFSGLSAQPYKNAVGIRAGYSSGLNFRHLTNDLFVLDCEALFNPKGFQLSGMYEYQFTPYDKKRVYFYAGGGLFAGNWDEETSAGIAAVFGSEFIFRQVPLTLGIEWKPMMNIYKNVDYLIPDFGLVVRFRLN